MWINYDGLHFNPREWQRPREFLPDRFDHENPLSLTPDGRKRHSHSWVPFHGGKRICFGKTFAELTTKIVATYLTQYFDLEMADKKYATQFPICHFGMSAPSKLDLILT